MARERLSDPAPAAGGFTLHAAGVPRFTGPAGDLRTGTRKALALAVLLVLDGPLRRDQLAALLWPEAEGADARRNLRRDVFRLRQAGLPVADAGGDALTLAGVALGWPDPLAATPRWLDGLEDAGDLADWLAPQRARLHQAWTERLCEQATRLEAEGRDREALGAWQALQSDDLLGPGHAAARQAVRRLGQRLEGLPAGLPPSGLPVRTPFVGREAEAARVRAAVQAGRLVFIDGPPGVGKTRLALEVAAELGGALWARCRPDDAEVPYSSALRLLQQLVEAAPDVHLPGWVRRELAPLLPAWATTADDDPPARVDFAARRKAFGTAWRELARGNFGALVIDDWQWADASSQDLWDLSQGDEPGAESPARLVVHRSAALDPVAAELQSRLVDAGRATRVTLDGLEPEAFGALVQQLVAGAPAPRVQRLHRATGGNPVFLLELLRHDAQAGLDGEALLPQGLRETVLARVRTLGPVVRQVLEAASLAGDAVVARELAGAVGLDELAVATVLEQAAAAQLLVLDERGHARFSHDLVAQALADSLAPARRAVLHARLAEAEAAAGAPAARVAQQLRRAGRDAEAAPWAERAGRDALRLGRFVEAGRQFAVAAETAPDAALATRALLGAALARLRHSDPAGADTLIGQALARAPAEDRALTADALLLRIDLWAGIGRAEEALALVRDLQADPALGDVQRQLAVEQEGDCLSVLGRHAEAVPLLRGLMAELPATAVSIRSRIRRTLARAATWAGDTAGALVLERESLQAALAAGDLFTASSNAQNLASHLREVGQPEEAMAMAVQALELSERSGNLHVLRATLYSLVVLHCDAGRTDLALPLIERAEHAAPFWPNPHLHQAFLEARLYVHLLRGEVDAAREAVPRVLAAARASNHLHFHLGGLNIVFDFHAALGEVSAMLGLVQEMQAALSNGSGDSVRADDLQLRDWQCRLLDGRAAEVAAELPQGEAGYARRRVDEQARQCGVAALALARCGRAAEAEAWIERGLALQGLSLELHARMLLAAREACVPSSTALRQRVEQRIQALLADPHLGALEARALRGRRH